MGKVTPRTKVLDLSREASSSESEGDGHAQHNETSAPANRKRARSDASDAESSTDGSEDEFEIPDGFDSVTGSSAITRDGILAADKQLWFFKLPKNVDASILAGASFRLDERALPGKVAARVQHDGKSYALQHEDTALTHQLVNALPTAKDRCKFMLGKPFTRCFSLLEAPQIGPEQDGNGQEDAQTSKSKKSKQGTALSTKSDSKKAKRKSLN